jgi:hypothetical protein
MQRLDFLPAHHRRLCRTRLPPRAFGIKVYKRIQFRLERRNSFKVRLDNLHRRKFLLAYSRRNLRNRPKNYFIHNQPFEW